METPEKGRFYVYVYTETALEAAIICQDSFASQMIPRSCALRSMSDTFFTSILEYMR